jgi:DNA-binding transcriptional regulator PaaX
MIEYPSKKILEKLLQDYQQIPTSTKLLCSMARFEDLYAPRYGYIDVLKRTFPFLPDLFGNEEIRQINRARVYNTRKDLIKTTAGRQGKHLILTSKGRKVYFRKYPLAKLRQRPWDGNWTLVSYDIPSNRQQNYLRDKLRRNLLDFGFGQLHQSLMISPLPLEEPVQEFIEGEKLKEFAVVMRSRRIWGFSDQEIARRAYDLGDLQLLYNELNAAFERAREEKADLELWRSYYLAVDNADPQLPNDLLPEGWPGDDAREKFISSFSILERIFNR